MRWMQGPSGPAQILQPSVHDALSTEQVLRAGSGAAGG